MMSMLNDFIIHYLNVINSSIFRYASSSVNCLGGCLQKNAEGASRTPPMPWSRASRAHRMESIATPAEFGESSTERRSSKFIGTSPKSFPSILMKHISDHGVMNMMTVLENLLVTTVMKLNGIVVTRKVSVQHGALIGILLMGN